MRINHLDSVTPDIPQEFFDLRNTNRQTEITNKFIAEGPEVVLRHLLSNHYVEALLIDEKQFFELRDIIQEKYARSPFKIYVASKHLISEIVGFKVHQGVLSLGRKPLTDIAPIISYPALALNGLANAENVGGVIRTAQAFGIKTFIVDGQTSDPWMRRSIRVSMGAIFSSEIVYCENLISHFTKLQSSKTDLRILALEQDERAVSVYDKKSPMSFDILVIGSEKEGISRDLLDSCSDICEIPISKSALNSLNVNCALSAFLAVHSPIREH